MFCTSLRVSSFCKIRGERFNRFLCFCDAKGSGSAGERLSAAGAREPRYGCARFSRDAIPVETHGIASLQRGELSKSVREFCGFFSESEQVDASRGDFIVSNLAATTLKGTFLKKIQTEHKLSTN